MTINCPVSDMDNWGEILVKPIGTGRYPISATVELTERCNLNCVHCYVNQPANSQKARESELNTAQWKKILDRIVDAGCLYVGFTGGEILLRPDFVELYTYAKRKGLIITLLTNATLIKPELADILATLRPHMVDITLYGATQETYERITRSPGSFKRFIQGIELLLERQIPVSLKSILMQENVAELEEIKTFAMSYGKELRYDAILWPRLDGSEAPYKHRLSAQQIIEMDHADMERMAEWQERADTFKDTQVRNQYVFSCGAGLRSFHIDCTGKMVICTMVRKPAFDLMKMDFSEAWDKLGEMRNMKRQLKTECETCYVGALCDQCPGWSQLVHADYETPVDYICDIGKSRAEHLALPMVQFIKEDIYE